MKDYEKYLRSKIKFIEESGIDVDLNELHPILFDYQKYLVKWSLKMGRSAIFTYTGTGKTFIQCEFARQLINRLNINVLIFAPLAVSQQTVEQAKKLGLDINNLRHNDFKSGCNISNYEQLHNIDTSVYDCIILDESSILKNYSGKIRNELIEKFSKTKYKLACTATPSPNDFMELGNHSEFLNIMSRKEMLAMYFIHDSGETQTWRLKKHANNIFWKWVSSWAAIMEKPSDLNFSDENYQLPKLNVYNEIVNTNIKFKDSVVTLLNKDIKENANTLSERQYIRKHSVVERVDKALEIINKNPNEIFLIWCDLNYESDFLKKVIPKGYEIRGSDKIEYKEKTMIDFAHGKIQYLITKPSIAGYGMNWQICHNIIFIGLSDSFESYFQAIRRCWRFGQKKDVNVYIITTDQEDKVLQNIARKEKDAKEMLKEMVEYTRLYVIENIKHFKKDFNLQDHNKKLVLPNFLKGEN